MKKIITLLTLILCSFSVMAEPEVVLELDSSVVSVGDTVTGYLVLKDFPETQGGGVNIKFNPKVLNASEITVDSAWNIGAERGLINNKRGVIKNLLFAAFPGKTGDIPVATIKFTAVGKGKSKIKLKPSKLNPFSGNGKEIDVALTKTRIKVIK